MKKYESPILTVVTLHSDNLMEGITISSGRSLQGGNSYEKTNDAATQDYDFNTIWGEE